MAFPSLLCRGLAAVIALAGCTSTLSATDAGGTDAPAADVAAPMDVPAAPSDLPAPTDLSAPTVDRPRVDSGLPRCRTDSDCGPQQGCFYVPGNCDAFGSCAPRVECLLPNTYCGCDGRDLTGCASPGPSLYRGSCRAGADAGPRTCIDESDCRAGVEQCIWGEGDLSCLPTAIPTCQPIVGCAQSVTYCGCGRFGSFQACAGRPTALNGGRGPCDAGTPDAG